MPALLNSSGTSSHSLGRTRCRGITYSHRSSPSPASAFLCCAAGAECALGSFANLNFPPLPNSVANRACADAAMAAAV